MKAFSTLAALVILVLCYGGFSAVAPTDVPTARGADDDGKKVFLAQGCNECHAVSTAEIEATTKVESEKGPDLKSIGRKYQGEWITKYIKKGADIEGKAHTKKFKGSDEELQVLVDWLLEQKAEDDDE